MALGLGVGKGSMWNGPQEMDQDALRKSPQVILLHNHHFMSPYEFTFEVCGDDPILRST
jgi:hypothetical protein